MHCNDHDHQERLNASYRLDEKQAVNDLLSQLGALQTQEPLIIQNAIALAEKMRIAKTNSGLIDQLLREYDLSSEEGIALMCLAEGLLRIPDSRTMDQFIQDKLSQADFKKHLQGEQPWLLKAATYSLLFTSNLLSFSQINETSPFQMIKKLTQKYSAPVLRPIILRMLKMIGNHFVLGETIQNAIARSHTLTDYAFSFDMLGEAARTHEDAKQYFQAYEHAILEMAKHIKTQDERKNPGISIKLSALHPRYEVQHASAVIPFISEKLLQLAKLAKQHHIGLTVDAEESDRLALSLTIFAAVFRNPELKSWSGFGLAVQAYQKRAPAVIHWLKALSQEMGKRIMVRLVKGAYWDSEIKWAQQFGLSNYPVFTRKAATDVSYLACAQLLLNAKDCFYPQFGTHNTFTVSAIFQLAKHDDFEFQCLHGMGQVLYDHLLESPNTFPHAVPVRIYAPVGSHQHLLGYLVRRLLENGANSSFVNQLGQTQLALSDIIKSPMQEFIPLAQKMNPNIPLPIDIFKTRKNSMGFDISDQTQLNQLFQAIHEFKKTPWEAYSILNGECKKTGNTKLLYSPCDLNDCIGSIDFADDSLCKQALDLSKNQTAWHHSAVQTRADILNRAADLIEADRAALSSLLLFEAGKCLPDAISEIREAADFCRYYAEQAIQVSQPRHFQGVTGEDNYMALHPRGLFVCISPWNFPLAIFTGQIVAALATGNVVIAKSAEQTACIATRVIQLLLKAGIPSDALQLICAHGKLISDHVLTDSRVDGVLFTGSTQTAKIIERTLAARDAGIACLVAETGGQNAMIVDSSALAEQSIIDIAQSAFNSAGQRCSALRILFLQEDIADTFLTMLSGYMQTMILGHPQAIETDVACIIDEKARDRLKQHEALLNQQARFVARVPNTSTLNGYYFSPCVYELTDLSLLTQEVFGPILHVHRFSQANLPTILQQIAKLGYGLTFGVHSRIEQQIQNIIQQIPVGNIYINRNMIGAQVGVQPFGGQGLSGTGPKAGGPHYLPRLCVERTVSINTAALGGNIKLISGQSVS